MERALFLTANSSDVLHPNRANVSKDELRGKLAELYKAKKDDVSVFGLRTQFGGGKSTGFALIYDSPEAMKKFEPHYRLVRYGMATKIEKASRQQRTSPRRQPERSMHDTGYTHGEHFADTAQASSARTARRSCAVPPRSRAPRRRRTRTKRLLHEGISSFRLVCVGSGSRWNLGSSSGHRVHPSTLAKKRLSRLDGQDGQRRSSLIRLLTTNAYHGLTELPFFLLWIPLSSSELAAFMLCLVKLGFP